MVREQQEKVTDDARDVECYQRNKSSSGSDIDKAVLKLLQRVCELQHRAWKENPIKARSKRRFVCGFGEVKKHLELGNAKLVIVAEDLEMGAKNNLVSENFEEVNNLCLANDVPVIKACKKHVIGRTLKKFPFVSVLVIINTNDIQELCEKALSLQKIKLILLRHVDQPSLFA
ncbi:unnamed protein product [Enterobius vermicularis]|uniref:Ribosomal_L7Ae domain-containing protein n=1 Tax=Enterobius vermicularis TaxID=51028 RepID=A0A0N4VED6_ENTVE|nr:unnamed protein product [Enterobius vermicularis]